MDSQSRMHMKPAYGRLALMAVLSFVAMYVLMYAMVDTAADIHNSLNQAYMAALMTAPMIALEVLLMAMMYPSKAANRAILAFSVVLGLGSFAAIRQQAGITDGQFLASMIPHHSGAVLMCREAPLRDPEIERLCRTIIAGQRAEIEAMERMRAR